MIELGKAGRDKVTGFEGIITARAQYLTGCDQYNLVPPVKDGKLDNAQWFDEGRIEIVGIGISAGDVAGPRPGGPQREAP
jgi:cyanophycinase-like exopeptidase